MLIWNRGIDSIEHIKKSISEHKKTSKSYSDFWESKWARKFRAETIFMISSVLEWFSSDWNPTLLEFYSIVIRAFFTENPNFDRNSRVSRVSKPLQSKKNQTNQKVLKEVTGTLHSKEKIFWGHFMVFEFTFGTIYYVRLKWTILGRDGRLKGMTVDDLVWHWTVLHSKSKQSEVNVPGWKWTLKGCQSRLSKVKLIDAYKRKWTVHKTQTEQLLGIKVDGLKEWK